MSTNNKKPIIKLDQILKDQGCELCLKKPVSAVKIEGIREHMWMCDECNERIYRKCVREEDEEDEDEDDFTRHDCSICGEEFSCGNKDEDGKWVCEDCEPSGYLEEASPEEFEKDEETEKRHAAFIVAMNGGTKAMVEKIKEVVAADGGVDGDALAAKIVAIVKAMDK